MRRTSARNELKSFFFGSLKWKLNRCLAPGLCCEEEAIRSHSLQNAKVLDLLSKNGHVKMLRHKIQAGSAVLSFEDVGRNQASTFEGFCAEHDRELFLPIDTRPIQQTDDEQAFLLSYRAVAKELHTLMQAASTTQSIYQKRVSLGIDTGNEPEEAGLLALQQMMSSYDVRKYKHSLDQALVERRFDVLEHISLVITHDQPSFAVSSLFEINERDKEDAPWICLNVFPISETESVVIFGFFPADSHRARCHVEPIVRATNEFQKYLLSKLVLMHCENFVVSPVVFDSWTEKKKDAIRQYFAETLRFSKVFDDSDLYLFS